MFDLSQLDTKSSAEEGSVMEVRHPTTQATLTDDSGAPITIRLAGSDSDRAQRMQRANLNRRLKTGGRRSAMVTAEELDVERLELLVACTLEWSGVALQGQEIECNAINARRVYSEVPWLREQAEDFVNDRANFLKASPKS